MSTKLFNCAAFGVVTGLSTLSCITIMYIASGIPALIDSGMAKPVLAMVLMTMAVLYWGIPRFFRFMREWFAIL